MNAIAAEKCATWEKKLKHEQFIIMEREDELTFKTKKEQDKFERKELGRLIERHHASIEAFNIKLDEFNQKCQKASKTAKTQQQRVPRRPGGIMPEEEVAASDALIKTLKGYYIQVKAAKRRAVVDDAQKRLNKNDFETIIITRPYIYAIWVGPYENRMAAKAAKETLLTDLKYDGYLIRFK